MISKKKTTIIVIIVLSALATYFFQKWQTKPNSSNTTIIDGLYEDQFDKMILREHTGVLTLVKKDDLLWYIQEKDDFPASSVKLGKLLEEINFTELNSLISKNSQKYKVYQVLEAQDKQALEEDNGLIVEIFKGEELLWEFILGKKRAIGNAQSQYFRYADKPEVYLLDQALSTTTSAKDWLSKNLFVFKEEDVQKFQFEKEEQIVSLERKEADFVSSNESEEVNKNEIKNYLSTIKKIEFDDIVSLKGDGWKSLQKTTLALKEDTQIIIELLQDEAEEEKNYLKYEINSDKQKWIPASELASKWFFEIPDWRATSFKKEKKDFVSEKPKEKSDEKKDNP